jgi:methylornithine synthase
MPQLRDILHKARDRFPLSGPETAFLLGLENEDDQEELFSLAREIRASGGNLISCYGFVYLSTHCRNDCSFCGWRKSNINQRRYRLTLSEVIRAAAALASQGVNLIDLTTGEDPRTGDPRYLESFAETVSAVREASGLPVMISPGVVPAWALKLFREAGALFYACYQETHTPELFRRLRPGQSFAERLQVKKDALRAGLLTEEGVLCGAGESAEDLARSVSAMRELKVSQARAMAYVPPGGDCLPGAPPGFARTRELLVTAVLRLTFPDALIPASLDVEGLAGLAPRLNAGASLITSLVPPGHGLAGVASDGPEIEEGERTLPRAAEAAAALGLRIATPSEYMEKIRAFS